MQTSPPASGSALMAALIDVELADAVDAVADGDGAAAPALRFRTGRRPFRPAIGGRVWEGDDRKASVVMMNPARRRLDQLLDGSVGGAGGERPEVAGHEQSPGGAHIERHRDAVFQNQGRAGRRYRNVAASLSVDVPPHRRAVLVVDLASHVPAADARVPVGIGVAGREGRAERGRQRDRLGATSIVSI